MLNNININTNNTFKNMPEHFSTNALSGVNNVQNSAIPSIKVSEAENPKKKRKIWSIITATMGSSILAAGAAVFLLNKGFSYTSYNKINKIVDILNDAIEKSALSKKSKNMVDKASIFLLKGVRNGLDLLKTSANFSAIKDSGFNMVARKFKFMRKPLDKLTDFFRNISTKAVDEAYHKVLLSIQEGFCPDISRFLTRIKADKSVDLEKMVTIKEVSKPLKVWLEELDTHQTNIFTRFSKGFSKTARNIRAQERADALEGLDKKVQDAIWDKNDGIFNLRKNGKKFKSYITESLSQEGKIKIKNNIITLRKELTNNIEHNYAAAKSGISDIRRTLLIGDEESSTILRKINGKMEVYKELGGELEDKQRIKIVDEISDLFGELESRITASPDYDESAKTFISKQVQYLSGDILKQSKKGELEEAVTIIRGLRNNGIIDEATESTLLNQSKSITKSITKATTMEADELYDKFAEFKVGSVPLDVLSLLFPLGVAGAAVASAKTKDEKISKTLTTGIPLVGSLATMLIGTAKMFTASKNLVIGIVTGFALNELGKFLDKTYKEYSEKRSFTKMAIEAYRKNPLFFNESQNVKK